MSSAPAHARPWRAARYEIVVRGDIGPALRRALAPVRAEKSEEQTVLRAHLGQGRELADLVHALRARGYEVASITVLA
jgi:hypothetical protein